MEKEDEFLHTYFTYVSQLCYEKAKEHLVCKIFNLDYYKNLYIFRRRKKNRNFRLLVGQDYLIFYNRFLWQKKAIWKQDFSKTNTKVFSVKMYSISFTLVVVVQFLFQNSLRAMYESMKNDLRKIDDNCKQGAIDKAVQKNCKNVSEFLNSRMNLIDL